MGYDLYLMATVIQCGFTLIEHSDRLAKRKPKNRTKPKHIRGELRVKSLDSVGWGQNNLRINQAEIQYFRVDFAANSLESVGRV